MSHTQSTMIRRTIGRFWCAVRHSRPSIEFESEGPDEVQYPGKVMIGANLTEEPIRRADWFAGSRVAAGGTTGQSTKPIKLIPGASRETTQPWYDEEGMEGMGHAVEKMKMEARRLEPRAQFSEPVVERVGDDDGWELALLVIDVYIPKESDGMEFRDRFFGRITDLLPRKDRARLAIGVGRLGPTA